MIKLPKQLEQALESDCGHTFEEILSAKKVADFKALRSLLSLDSSIKPTFRQHAIHLLGHWGNPDVVPQIADLLPQLDERERINAIDALGQLGTREALEALSGQVNDPSPDVRRFVVIALGRIGGKLAMGQIKQIAETEKVGFVRSKATQLLQKESKKGMKRNE